MGEEDAFEPVSSDSGFALVYDELRKLAAKRLANEPAGISLQPTGLVHEAYIRLVNSANRQDWDNRGHFFGSAAEAMRRILVERARKRSALKRRGDRQRVQLPDDIESDQAHSLHDIIVLNEALTQFEATEPRKATLVKLRYYCGMTLNEASEAMGISSSTADADWAYAKAWLKVRLAEMNES